MSHLQTEGSQRLYEAASQLMPGGVNSPVRAFRAVGGTPLFISRAKGSHLFDVDGNEYIDYVSSWGAVILGHADDAINLAISEAAQGGTSFGASHEGELKLATEVVKRMPGVEMVRFVNSGTEASLAALRLARAATGRTKIVKFEGCYHGAVDALLSKSGSGVATLDVPDSAGVPTESIQSTITAPFNNSAAIEEIFNHHGKDIAALIVEPVAGNMGVVLPDQGFLPFLREITSQYGAILIMDEVMTGFRVSIGGASQVHNIIGDLVTMGKIIGGGLPVGAYGGKKELMELVAPVGPVYQAGTLSGNPLAMAAGYAALSHLTQTQYVQLENRGARLQSGLQNALLKHNRRAQVQRSGSMISVFFNPNPVTDFSSAQQSDKALFASVFHNLLAKGVYLPPSALEAWFLNCSHSEDDIERTIVAFEESLEEAQN